ncbi:MAG TPA: HAD-IA family hydrolase, partial [Ktedonobacteraceae bacterium]|nr:HAD-IA family hydrolase [Ktedonobacteraceae bacterium]
LGTIAEEEVEKRIGEIMGMDQGQVAALMADLWEEYLGELNVELAAYFASLRPRYQTAILSNSFAGARDKEQERYHFAELCDLLIYSHEEGIAKPERRIFELTCERLGVQPAEVVFLDNVEANIAAARAFGMQAILFRETEEAIGAIQACLQASSPPAGHLCCSIFVEWRSECPGRKRLRRLLMTYRAFTHIALIVTPLRQAEEFYRALFALEVAFREAEAADGWDTLPSDASWDDAEAAGISLGLCSLHRDAFTLALEDGASSAGGRLSHIGAQVDAEDLERLRTVAPTLGCQVVQDGPTILVFDDPYGVRWEVTTTSYDDPRRLSTGARAGRWLNIGQEQ